MSSGSAAPVDLSSQLTLLQFRLSYESCCQEAGSAQLSQIPVRTMQDRFEELRLMTQAPLRILAF